VKAKKRPAAQKREWYLCIYWNGNMSVHESFKKANASWAGSVKPEIIKVVEE
jgi:hypothetical protein